MPHTLDQLPPRLALVEIARDFHARGWMPGTAGNLSIRAQEGFWITASGCAKGRLQETDFLLLDVARGTVIEQVHSNNQPSAEASIHRAIYDLFPEAIACLHVHSLAAAIVSNKTAARANMVRLPSLEIIKGFGIWQQNPKIDLPLFANHLDVEQIAHDIKARFQEQPPPLTALLIHSHGVTVWGKSLQQAYDRVECLEFLLSYEARAD